ncbi:response regulator transcription factor [Alkaliphilus crotonatoxidans]
MEKILVVDDNIQLVETISIYLENAGFQVFQSYNGKCALDYLNLHEIDLIIMDIMMPEKDGISVTKELRAKDNIPIILLSAKSEEKDKVEGLDSGADDYITKPFSKDELIARVKAQLRRYKNLNKMPSRDSEILIRGLKIDYDSKTVTLNDDIINLTPTEFKILYLLARNKGKVLSIKMIYESVWEQEFLNSENTVMFHISNLRSKLEIDVKKPMYLKVVWGQGYMVD